MKMMLRRKNYFQKNWIFDQLIVVRHLEIMGMLLKVETLVSNHLTETNGN